MGDGGFPLSAACPETSEKSTARIQFEAGKQRPAWYEQLLLCEFGLYFQDLINIIALALTNAIPRSDEVPTF
jgi:hypothetical protein